MSWAQVECVKCGQPMGDRDGMFVDGKPWHTACHYNVLTARLAEAEDAAQEAKEILAIAVGRKEETLARFLFAANTERIAAIEAARWCYERLDPNYEGPMALARWPWLAEEEPHDRT